MKMFALLVKRREVFNIGRLMCEVMIRKEGEASNTQILYEKDRRETEMDLLQLWFNLDKISSCGTKLFREEHLYNLGQ